MATEYNPNIFDDGDVHIVRLGYFLPSEAGYSLVLDDRIGGHKRGFGLEPQFFDLLVSLDPTESDRNFTQDEQALLIWMADQGILSLIGVHADLVDFNMIPVSRQPLSLVEELEQGYRIRVGDGEPFTISEIAFRFLPLIDGLRTLGEIAALVERDTLANTADRQMAMQVEHDHGRNFGSLLREEVFHFIGQVTRSGAMTFEPES